MAVHIKAYAQDYTSTIEPSLWLNYLSQNIKIKLNLIAQNNNNLMEKAKLSLLLGTNFSESVVFWNFRVHGLHSLASPLSKRLDADLGRTENVNLLAEQLLEVEAIKLTLGTNYAFSMDIC